MGTRSNATIHPTRLVHKTAHILILLLAVPAIAFEDLVIRRLFRLAAHLPQRFGAVKRAEDWARTLTPPSAAALLFLPALLVACLEVLTTILLVSGHFRMGAAAWIFGKAVPTILVGRIIDCCNPALSQYAWFRFLDRLYHRIHHFAHDALDRAGIYPAWRGLRRHWKGACRVILKRKHLKSDEAGA